MFRPTRRSRDCPVLLLHRVDNWNDLTLAVERLHRRPRPPQERLQKQGNAAAPDSPLFVPIIRLYMD